MDTKWIQFGYNFAKSRIHGANCDCASSFARLTSRAITIILNKAARSNSDKKLYLHAKNHSWLLVLCDNGVVQKQDNSKSTHGYSVMSLPARFAVTPSGLVFLIPHVLPKLSYPFSILHGSPNVNAKYAMTPWRTFLDFYRIWLPTNTQNHPAWHFQQKMANSFW